MDRWAYATTKRIFDLCVSAMGILATLPLMAGAGAAVVAADGGKALFKQQRVGRMGVEFEIIKLRTMSEGSAGSEVTAAGDVRVTGVGAFLRRYKLDELPQLINVLRGEMSLVGPRPEVPRYVDFYSDEQMKLLEVKPGITDPASLMFWNEAERLAALPGDHETSYIKHMLGQKLALAIFYQRHATFVSDIRIILSTVGRALRA